MAMVETVGVEEEAGVTGMLAREVLAMAIVETGEVERVLVGSVEHTVEYVGKKDSLESGRGRIGPGAVPTIFPGPGKFVAADAVAFS